MKQIYLYFSFFAFVGCALVGVPESGDPRVKLQQGVILNNGQERGIGALHLFDQAISLAKEKNDKETEATAEFYIGEIYKAPGKRSEHLRNPQTALDHYSKAISIYNEIKYYKSVSFVHWNSSAAYDQLNKKNDSCEALKESKKYAEKIDSNPKDTLAHVFNDGGMLVI